MKFKVGDRVRVRAWDDMVKEFGLDDDGDIECEICFSREMKQFCGKIFTVEKVFDISYDLKGGESFCFSDDMLEPVTTSEYNEKYNEKIVITSDGKTTFASLYNKKAKVKLVEVECPPECKYNFEKGAKLAFDKLMGVKEYNYETNKPEDETEKLFVPHLECCDWNLGEIGKETKFVDAVGRKLCVGDIVELFDNSESYGDSVVVEDNNTQFVMGIIMSCDCKSGHISNGWKIIKKRSYRNVKNGEEIDDVKFVTEDPHKYYSGKLVCVDDDGSPYWTVGKIYECVNGVLDSNKRVSYVFRKYESLEHINKCCGAKFIELKI